MFVGLFLENVLVLLVVLCLLSHTFIFSATVGAPNSLVKLFVHQEKLGQAAGKPLACVMQEILERTANGTYIFHPSNLDLYQTAKLIQKREVSTCGSRVIPGRRRELACTLGSRTICWGPLLVPSDYGDA